MSLAKWQVRQIQPDGTYQLRHSVLRPNQTLADCAYPFDTAPGTCHVGCYDGDELLGVGTIFREGQDGSTGGASWRIRGMAVTEQARGTGVGGQILLALIAHAARQQPSGEVWCNGRANVEGFYRRYGFARVGEIFDLPPLGPHVLMVRPLTEADR